MKTYKARVFGNVFVECGLPDPVPLSPRLELRNHSPTGFAWGYNGSGPAQLALAILCDVYDDDKALRLYQQFKDWVIAKQDREKPFLLTATEVMTAVDEIEALADTVKA